MELRIVKADPERRDDYIAIMLDSILYDHYWADDDSTLYGMIDEALARGTLLIAEKKSDGEAVGLIDCRWKGMFEVFPYLALIGVKKAYRGMGVGRDMLRTFEAVSRSLGAEKIFLCVDGFNPRARHLYVSEGYVKYGFIPDLFKKGCDENIMMKIL